MSTKNELITAGLFALSIICFFLSLVIIYNWTTPSTYQVEYSFKGTTEYAEVSGDPNEIIDELISRQIIHEIIPIR